MDNDAPTAAVDTVAAPEPIAEASKVEAPASPEPKAEPKLEQSPRGAVERAMAKLDAQEKAKAAESDRPRGPDGKFISVDAPQDTAQPVKDAPEQPKAAEKAPEAPKAQTPFSEPPSRFSADAKAAWATLPDAVKAETHRALKEMEQGIEKYRTTAASFEELREFDDLAKKSGTTMKAAMANYVGIEKMLMADPIKGLNQIAENMGFSLRDIAAHIMGQTPDQAQSQSDATIRALKAELAEVKQQVSGVTKTFEEQRTASVAQQVEAFAKEHPRFEELSADIEFFLSSGRTKDLSEAYQLAERLNPAPAAPAPVIAAPAAIVQDPAAQTRKGSLSVTGAPGNGSDPALRKPSSSIRDSIRNARAAVG